MRFKIDFMKVEVNYPSLDGLLGTARVVRTKFLLS